MKRKILLTSLLAFFLAFQTPSLMASDTQHHDYSHLKTSIIFAQVLTILGLYYMHGDLAEIPSKFVDGIAQTARAAGNLATNAGLALIHHSSLIDQALFASTIYLQWNRIYFPRAFFLIRALNLAHTLSRIRSHCSDFLERESSDQAFCALDVLEASTNALYLGQAVHDYFRPTTAVLEVFSEIRLMTCSGMNPVPYFPAKLSVGNKAYWLAGRSPVGNEPISLVRSVERNFPILGSLFPLDFLRASNDLKVYFDQTEIVLPITVKKNLLNFLKFGPGLCPAIILYTVTGICMTCHDFASALWGRWIPWESLAYPGSPSNELGRHFLMTLGDDHKHSFIFMGTFGNILLTLSKIGQSEIIFVPFDILVSYYGTDGLRLVSEGT